MKHLSRDEMKKVMGGYEEDKECTSNSDCGNRDVNCNGQIINVSGICRDKKCYWAAAC